ncbi:pre-mRNA splicing factor domain-containing protein [Actinidia rufa]|uniref:Pre-mRNA splicing factor domain-containing protein n=1 Tax=Actinidia rufa TaxID=165716 RepID=A0A7J0FXF7_9ERIC|nr:pre-mRNA splicing factor domain-containing protein [Actinidia rufa]
MALKFLNKKGWHTGSLRNIENVWKAEQKHDAEQKKLEELRKQIQEERERSEFRLLQEQAGLVPRQERLDFLYDSGLAVGKGSSDGFKALEAFPKPDPQNSLLFFRQDLPRRLALVFRARAYLYREKNSQSSVIPSNNTLHFQAYMYPTTSRDTNSSFYQQQQPSVPGALFEEKPQSANDAWRKLHSDPLLLIRQREQEALARVRNNPIQMAMIRKSPSGDTCAFHTLASLHCFLDIPRVKRVAVLTPTDYLGHLMQKSKQRRRHLKVKTSERNITTRSQSIRSIIRKHSSSECHSDSEDVADDGEYRKSARKSSKSYEHSNKLSPSSVRELKDRNIKKKRNIEKDNMYKEQPACALLDSTIDNDESREERAARLREMQMDAELHEEQRWKRLKKADENDAQEALCAHMSSRRNFLDAAHKSVYGADKGGSSTIEESVRRRTHYLQSRAEVGEGNAFRR